MGAEETKAGIGLSTQDSLLVADFGGDLVSTGVGSQSGMPGSCWPVKQTGCNLTADNFEYALAA